MSVLRREDDVTMTPVEAEGRRVMLVTLTPEARDASGRPRSRSV